MLDEIFAREERYIPTDGRCARWIIRYLPTSHAISGYHFNVFGYVGPPNVPTRQFFHLEYANLSLMKSVQNSFETYPLACLEPRPYFPTSCILRDGDFT